MNVSSRGDLACHARQASSSLIQPISAHAWTALPESGDVVLSDALVITAALAQFAATLYGECLAPDVWAAWQAPKSARF